MGPVSCNANKFTIIAYAILMLITMLQLERVKASPLPKTIIPPLEGPSNYKQWASLVKNSLIVNSNKPDEEYEKIVNKPATDTKKEISTGEPLSSTTPTSSNGLRMTQRQHILVSLPVPQQSNALMMKPQPRRIGGHSRTSMVHAA
jgi:hypothetical protein